MGNVKGGLSILLVAALLLQVAGCRFQRQMDGKFGDQNFKSAVALVELYKVRHGHYPQSLADLHYLGGWDPIYLRGVKYRRIGHGYELDIEHGWVGRPKLSYPPGFWHGLGIVATNVGGFSGDAPHASDRAGSDPAGPASAATGSPHAVR